ncbi:MAG: hypothetical protein M0020_03875 [Actinomycetota bacterium]|nr:hypothetical protein [Actinomycetota bacterium]
MSTARRGRSGGLLRSDRLVRMGRLAVPAVASWLGARAVVSLAFLLAHGLSGHLHHTLAAAGGSGAFTTHDRLAQGLLGWDASWYSAIAAHGYAGVGHASLRFFPLTPMAAWIVGGLLGIGPGDGLLVVANAAALVAGILVARLAWRELGDGPTGRRATWLLSLSPAAFVLAMGYAEPLFLALAAGVFLAVRPKRQQGHGTQHWWVAAVLGFMAGLARPQGVLLSLGVAVEAWREIRARKAGLLGREPGAGAGDSVAAPAGFPAVRTPAMAAGPALAPWRSNAGPIVATLAPLAGGGSYLLWVAWRYGGLFTPLSIQTSAARRGGFADPFATLARDVGDLVSFHHVGTGLHLVWAVVAVALCVVCWRRLPASYSLFATAVIAVALSGANLDSFERYLLTAFPLAIAGATILGKRKWVEPAVYAGLAIAMAGYCTLAFLNIYVP